MFIIGQLFIVLGKAIEVCGLLIKNKFKMYFILALASISYGTGWVLLGSPLAVASNVITIFRNFSYHYIEKNNPTKLKYMLSFAIQIVAIAVVFILYFKNFSDIFVLAGVFILGIGLTLKRTVLVRISLLITCILWLAYDIYFGAYINVVLDSFSTLSILISLVLYHLIPYIKSRAQNRNK